MARFVSRYKEYSHGVQNEIREYFATGHDRVVQKHIEAKFQHGLVTDEDYEAALSILPFSGLPEDRDTEGLVSPRSRLSVFDSEIAQFENGWTDAETELVIDSLRNSSEKGSAYLEIEKVPLETPWANYDSIESPEKIVEVALMIGADLAAVIAYEKENRNAAPVVYALEEAKAVLEADSVVIEA
jgi:hypothetical protein